MKNIYFDMKKALCVPTTNVGELLGKRHDANFGGHVGFAKTLGRLDPFCWSKNKGTSSSMSRFLIFFSEVRRPIKPIIEFSSFTDPYPAMKEHF